MMQLAGLIFIAIGIVGMNVSAKKISLEKYRMKAVNKSPNLFHLKQWIKEKFNFKSVKTEKWLKKFLMRAKIFFLKCENKIDDWLKKISQSKKFSPDYWEKLKKK